MTAGYVASIDQGTTSTRCILIDHRGLAVAQSQREHRQHYPRPGWVEHDPLEIWENTRAVIAGALAEAGARAEDIHAVGVTNQRETTVVWDPTTGRPYCNAIVWQDTRTGKLCDRLAGDGGIDRFRETTGLPLSTYFSGPKLAWLLGEVEGLRAAALEGRALFGNIDSWLIWNLTGGTRGGAHVCDVTNASRTMLMDLESASWDEAILAAMDIPERMLPTIRPSSDREPYGFTLESGPFGGRIPVTGALGDQQAALVGQACFKPGEAKNTYGTGCFLLLNTGDKPVRSKNGLLTTVAYQLGDEPAAYALEGSVATAGALVQWLRDQLGIISSAPEIEQLAGSVDDCGDVYMVPAFSGLFAPYWRKDARGTIVGLTPYATRGHIARAALEAVAFQTWDLCRAMCEDSHLSLKSLKVDGGMVQNELLMQVQADMLGVEVVRPVTAESTALGAAYAAGLAVGFWKDKEEIAGNWSRDKAWAPAWGEAEREAKLAKWKKAVEKSLGWLD
jgi:glycerol kinase